MALVNVAIKWPLSLERTGPPIWSRTTQDDSPMAVQMIRDGSPGYARIVTGAYTTERMGTSRTRNCRIGWLNWSGKQQYKQALKDRRLLETCSRSATQAKGDSRRRKVSLTSSHRPRRTKLHDTFCISY